MATPSSLSDSTSASLIERARDLEPGAWERMSKIYGPLVYRWCRRAGLQEADAADVVQEVFRAVTTGLHGFREEDPGGFRGWLFGITRNKVADHHRAAAKRPKPLGDGHSAASTNPERALEVLETDRAADTTIVLHLALDQIRGEVAEHNWQAFRRIALGGEQASVVADELGLTAGAVRQAKFRILRRLRQELEGWQFAPSD